MTEFHKNILRALLTALGITAAAGVLSVLLENTLMLRVTGTGFVAVLAAVIMLKIAVSLDNPKLRNAAMFGLVVVAIELLITFAIIWGDSFGIMRQMELWGTFWFIVPWALFTSMAVRAFSLAFSRLAGVVGLSFAAGVLFAVLAAIWGDHSANVTWAQTSGLVALLGLSISCSCVGIGIPADSGVAKRHWQWIGIAMGVAALVMGMIDIWSHDELRMQKTSGKTVSILSLISVFVGFASIVVLTPLKANQRWLMHGTLALGFGLCTLLGFLALGFGKEESMLRFTGATAIPTVCGAIALATVARLNKRAEFGMATPDYLLIHLTCPRCRAPQQLKPGKSTCDSCALKFEIAVEEPNCPNCNYSLYMLEGNVCPECGTAIKLTEEKPTQASAFSLPPFATSTKEFKSAPDQPYRD